MFHTVDLLSKNDVEKLRTAIAAFEFKDGKASAGGVSSRVKNNLQAFDFASSDVAGSVMNALKLCMPLRDATYPKTMSPLTLSKYSKGMEYGFHVDNVHMHNGRVRSDLGMTLFLSDPESYEGGELEVLLGSGERSSQLYKLPAGSLVVYPANYLHRVRPVTHGERLAIICWIQSQYRDAEQREIIRQLRDAQKLLAQKHKNSPVLHGTSRALNSLQRMWSGV